MAEWTKIGRGKGDERNRFRATGRGAGPPAEWLSAHRTSQVEIRILQKIFSPEEAALASQLTGALEPVDGIARRAGLPAGEVSKRLFKMVRRGLVWLDKQDGKACFRLAPFVVGFYEAQAESMDHELAHLVEEYFSHGGGEAIMRYATRLAPGRPGAGGGQIRVGAAV